MVSTAMLCTGSRTPPPVGLVSIGSTVSFGSSPGFLRMGTVKERMLSSPFAQVKVPETAV
jgi:hypothetical protein